MRKGLSTNWEVMVFHEKTAKHLEQLNGFFRHESKSVYYFQSCCKPGDLLMAET